MPSGPDEGFLEKVYQAIRGRAAGMAPHFQPGVDGVELDGDDLETLWNRRAMSLEDEWNLHRAKQPDGTPLYSREQIGAMVFPEREKLARKGGRVEPREFISWTNSTARRMAQKREVEAQMSALSPVTPEPMEGSPYDV